MNPRKRKKIEDAMSGFEERLRVAEEQRQERNPRIRQMAKFYRAGLLPPASLYVRGPNGGERC